MIVLGARTAALILAWFAVAEAAPHNHDYYEVDPNSLVVEDKVSCEDVIQKDFAIVGGGSSGTYSAIRLKEMGHDIVLIEAKDQLGVSLKLSFCFLSLLNSFQIKIVIM